MQRRGRHWAVLIGCLAAQLVVLYLPRTPGAPTGWDVDKVIHAAIFAAPAYAAVRWQLAPRWVVPLLATHAVISEVIQGVLLPARSGDATDALADLLGVAIGAVVGWRRSGGRRRAALVDSDTSPGAP